MRLMIATGQKRHVQWSDMMLATPSPYTKMLYMIATPSPYTREAIEVKTNVIGN